MEKTHPSLFIIESVRFADEKAGRLEGHVLKQILNLSGKEAEYVYVRTAKELSAVLEHFAASKYRYLHISSHGNASQIALTLDTLSFSKFANFSNRVLKDRRLFISACAVVNAEFAKAVMPSECHSIVGPSEKISFADAAMMWASFYHLVFKANPNSMDMKRILTALRATQSTFGTTFKYFARSGSANAGFKEHSTA